MEPLIPLATWEDAPAIAAPGIVGGVVALAFNFYLQGKINKMEVGKDIGKPVLDKMAGQVRTGSMAFLRIEYQYLSVFVIVVALVLGVLFTNIPIKDSESDHTSTDGFRVGGSFLVGAFLSALAGWFGMNVATLGNVRTTVACYSGTLNDGLTTAFTAGAVMGFTVVGLGLAGVSLTFLVQSYGKENDYVMEILAGFGTGASSIALFARVAGGIYTKAADVGADLVGKVEAGIDEDDPHNPAVIADNVGDNVGDVAGMGADLFESYVGSIVACASLAGTQHELIVLPFALASLGIFCSLFGYAMVGTDQEGQGVHVELGKLMWALEKGMYFSAALFIALSGGLMLLMFGTVEHTFIQPGSGDNDPKKFTGLYLWFCIILGLVGGALIGKVTEYFTSFDFGPVISIKDRGAFGPATVVIQGIGVGMISCGPPTAILVATILGCSALAGPYGVAVAAVGMLATLGITLATDAYGPVADNAGGLAEMGHLGPEVRAKTDSLDALGNTTAATGKGFAIGSAVLTALSLLAAFQAKVDPEGKLKFKVSSAEVMGGCLFGAMLPYLFGALTMISVGKAAAEIIDEVRRQFREIPGLRAAIERASNGETIPESEDVDPNSDRCVAISTQSSIKEMLAPGAYAVLAPIFIGFTVGAQCLMGMLAGSIVSGAMTAIMMSNAGGAWDNAKKLCEKLNLKKTEQGKAAVIGDTVGDPFKDTSGPSLNILIKLMSMVSLLIAPALRDKTDYQDWQYGLAPLGVAVVLTAVLMAKGILSWEDPMAVKLAGLNPPEVVQELAAPLAAAS